MRAEAVAGDGGLEASRRRVQPADQVSCAAQRDFGPGIGREPVPVPGLPARVVRDVAVDIGQHFPVTLDSHPRRALEPGCLQMAQVPVHRG